jgi:Holliday junction resolvase RusA-like endonuclease
MTELRVYTVPGVPVAWARAIPKGNYMFDSQKQIKLFYGITIRNQHPDKMYTGALLLDVTFHFPMPMTKKKQWDEIRNSPHKITPDCSNCIKFLEDAICGVLIKDDCIISDIVARKRYADDPRTVFKLIEL